MTWSLVNGDTVMGVCNLFWLKFDVVYKVESQLKLGSGTICNPA